MSLKATACVIVFLAGLDHPANAHDIYSHLKDSWGNSCCDGTDCRPAPYRPSSGGVQMFIDGHWIDVPDHTIQHKALLEDPGTTNGGHWCGRAYQQRNGSVFHVTQCAILPPSTTELLRPPFAVRESRARPIP